MKRTVQTFLVVLLLALAALPIRTQAQPSLDLQLVMPANPSPYLSDWQSDAGSIQLIATSQQPYSQPVKIAAQVSLNGQVVAATKPEKMPMLELHQGTNSFNATSIIPLQAVNFSGGIDQSSRRAGRLPEGSYEICVGFIDAATSAPVGTSACHPFAIMDVQPPTLLSPAEGTRLGRKQLVSGEQTTLEFQVNVNDLGKIEPSAFANLKSFDLVSGTSHTTYLSVQPEQLNAFSRLMEHEGIFYRFRRSNTGSGNRTVEPPQFSWLPPMPAPAAPVQYKLRIVEILPAQTASQAIQTAQPVFEKDGIPVTSFTGEEEISRLFQYNQTGSSFGWAVQAHDASGNPIGKNNGWSETRTFDIGDAGKESEAKSYTLESFFDVFSDIPQHPAPCPYRYKKYIRNFYTPCKDGWMEIYGIYEIFTCTLAGGHAGPHEGTTVTVYVNEGKVGCSDRLKAEPLPPGAKTMTGKEIATIPTKEIADKGDVKPIIPAKEPCDHTDKKLLRTVVGSWKRGATTVRHITYHGTTVAWADVTWTRDIWNVFSVSHCTLLKGHAGAHKMGPAKEEFIKYSTVTEKVTYGTGVPQVPPSPHWSDSLPHEDPH